MSTARSRTHPARRVPRPRLDRALVLVLGLVQKLEVVPEPVLVLLELAVSVPVLVPGLALVPRPLASPARYPSQVLHHRPLAYPPSRLVSPLAG